MPENTATNENLFDMLVLFSTEKENKKIVDGSFIVTPKRGISCIGENQLIEFGFSKDEMYSSGIFQGVIVEHILEKETASISLTIFDVIQDPLSSLGKRQVAALQAELDMGILSGSKNQDSIMIGPGYKFLYRTILFRRKHSQ